MITMDSKAQLTVDIIAKVAQGKITIVNAAKLLNKSRRTIERYLKKYQQVGIQFVVHQNVGIHIYYNAIFHQVLHSQLKITWV
jgi:predicted DNA-binding transcriptional regulator YafY